MRYAHTYAMKDSIDFDMEKWKRPSKVLRPFEQERGMRGGGDWAVGLQMKNR